MTTTETIIFCLSPDLKAAIQTIADQVALGKPLDPELVRRIQQESQHIQDDLREKHGILDIGVPAIRELRGELPQP